MVSVCRIKPDGGVLQVVIDVVQKFGELSFAEAVTGGTMTLAHHVLALPGSALKI